MQTEDNTLVDTIGKAWTAQRTTEQLQLDSIAALNALVARADVLELPTSEGAFMYPVFQFTKRDEKILVKTALQAMFHILHDVDAWETAMLLNMPAPELSRMSPVDWERAVHDTAALVELARVIRQEIMHP